jgi:hypothetical protein
LSADSVGRHERLLITGSSSGGLPLTLAPAHPFVPTLYVAPERFGLVLKCRCRVLYIRPYLYLRDTDYVSLNVYSLTHLILLFAVVHDLISDPQWRL